MRFIRENLFFVLLICLTLAIGAAGLAWYFASGVGDRLNSRRGVSKGLLRLSRRSEKISEQTVHDHEARIAALRAAAKKDTQDSILLNRKNLPVLQLNNRQPAFPFDAQAYSLGLDLVFIQQYGRTLNDMISPQRTDLRRTATATRKERDQEKALLTEQYKEKAEEAAIRSMKIKKAQAGLVFIEDAAMDRYFTRENKAPGARLWEAQVNLWVTEEVLQAIIAANRELAAERKAKGIGSKNHDVTTSAVKRLVKLNITEAFEAPSSGMMGGRSRRVTLTHRGTTAEHALIRYRFRVIMPSRHVPRLLRNLMVANYHTVVDVAMAALPAKGDGYYYGVEPVMDVDIVGELLLVTDWIRPLMPPDVQKALPLGKAGR